MTAVRTLTVAAMLLGGGNTQSPSRPSELAVVTGTVREPDGSSVSGAKVELRRPSDRANALNRITLSNPDGSFRIEGVSPGAYYVSVSRAGFVRVYYSKDQGPVDNPGDLLDISPGATIRLNFLSVRAGAISGRVINPFGLPAVRAEVSAVAVRQRSWSGVFDEWVATLPTDVDGSYRLAGLEPGEYRVVAQLADMRPAPLGASDGPPRVLKPTYYPATITREDAALVTVMSGTQTSGIDITVHLHPSYRITGQVLGLPEGARVSMSITSADVSVSPTVTPTGAFDSLEQLPAGRYQAIVRTTGRPPGTNLWAKADIVVNTNIEGFLLPLQGTSTVTGLAVSTEDLPVSGVSIGLAPLGSPFNLGGGPFAIPSGTTAATGQFEITDLVPGAYRVIVSTAKASLRAEASLNGVPLVNGIFEIQPGRSVSGLTIRIR